MFQLEADLADVAFPRSEIFFFVVVVVTGDLADLTTIGMVELVMLLQVTKCLQVLMTKCAVEIHEGTMLMLPRVKMN
jgi:hypothetical protein